MSNESDDECVHAVIRDNPGLRAAELTRKLKWEGEDIRRLDRTLQRLRKRRMIEVKAGARWVARGIDAKPRSTMDDRIAPGPYPPAVRTGTDALGACDHAELRQILVASDGEPTLDAARRVMTEARRPLLYVRHDPSK